MSRIAACTLLLLLLTPAFAAGQQGPAPRVHLGAQVPALARWPAAGARVELRAKQQESLEIALDWHGDVGKGEFARPLPRAVYSIAYKRRFADARHPSMSWFVTVGGLGYYNREGSLPPILPVAGAGVERLLGRLGLHVNVQVPPANLLWYLHNSQVGPQAHVGLFVPLARR